MTVETEPNSDFPRMDDHTRDKGGTFVQNVHRFLIRSSTSGFCPDATNRVTQELLTPKFRATSAPD